MAGELAAEGYPLVMLASDLCRLLRIHENTLYRRIRSGDVPAFQRTGSGRRSRYEWKRADVERWWANPRRGLRRVG